jgi:ribonuclease VapC
MVVDTSILVAVILKEEGYEELVFKMAEADARYLSAASYLEASIVLLRRRGKGIELELDRVLYESEILIVPVTGTHARTGRQAFLEYGKGRHPAQLTSAIALPIPWQSRRESLCSFWGMISA